MAETVAEPEFTSDLLNAEFLDGTQIISTQPEFFPGAVRPESGLGGKATYDESVGIDPMAADAGSNVNMDVGKSFDGIWPEYCNPTYVMPDEIEVKVKLPGGDYYFPVAIVKANESKLYYGGYRNKMTGSLYHHASSQTPSGQKRKEKNNDKLRSRDTQTHDERTLSVQPYRESGTQMERVDLRLDNKRDKIKIPKTYFTSEQLYELKLAKTIFIQRCWRGYMARCRAYRLKERNINFEKRQREAIEVKKEEERLRREVDMRRRLNPKSNSDFATLYNELDVWRKGEIARVKATTMPGKDRVDALAAILTDETKALQSIQKLKISAQKSLTSEKTKKMLEQMTQPHRWQLSGGDVAYVQTPETKRSKELLDLYIALEAPIAVVEERLDVLLYVKWAVKEFNCQLSRDISDLVDREADLLNRGRAVSSMSKLRVRLLNLFLQFIENPEFNPRAKDFIKLPNASE